MSALDRLTRNANTGLVLDAEEVREVLAHIAWLKTQRDELLSAAKNPALRYTTAAATPRRARNKALRELDAAITNATGG